MVNLTELMYNFGGHLVRPFIVIVRKLYYLEVKNIYNFGLNSIL